jgi:cobalt-zinc-cadmium efflux system outer membrane protein
MDRLRLLAFAWLVALAAAALGPAAVVLAQQPPANLLPPQAPAASPTAPLDKHEELRITPARLDELEQLAEQNHPQIVAAWNGIRSAEGKAIQARLYPNPVVGAASPQLAGSESQYNVFFQQDILTGGKLRLSTAAACQEIEQARLSLVRARFDVLTGVRRQFYATLAAQNRAAVLDDLVALAARSHKIGEALLKGGEGTRTDTLLLEVELHKAQVAQQNARTVFETGRRQLAAAIGLPQMPLDSLYGDLSAELPQLSLDEVQQGAATLNAKVGIAELEVHRSRILLDRAIVEPSPTFNLMAGYQYQVSPAVHDQGIMQATMTVPLWDRNQGNIRSAQAQVGRAEAEVRRVQVELAAEAAQAMSRFVAAQQLADKYRQDILPKSRESVDLTQRLYEQGQIDFLRLLSAQRTLSEVNLSYIDAQAIRWDAAAEIANLLQVEEFP